MTRLLERLTQPWLWELDYLNGGMPFQVITEPDGRYSASIWTNGLMLKYAPVTPSTILCDAVATFPGSGLIGVDRGTVMGCIVHTDHTEMPHVGVPLGVKRQLNSCIVGMQFQKVEPECE